MKHEDVFQTVADPTRRRVIDALRRGERSVNEIVATVGIHQSGVSRHLGILTAAGFVQSRADGARRLYSLRPAPFREVAAWVSRYCSLWERRGLTRRDRRAQRR